MTALRYIDFPELLERAQRASNIEVSCRCNTKVLTGWESPLVSSNAHHLLDIGTLSNADEEDLTINEYHPSGTHYWSTQAPIAPRYYPYNRCKVSECLLCGRCYLRYSESGAYHIEPRIRYLDPALIVDAPLPA
ncbi:hypothetical protein NJC40_18585 [Pseudomonas sp. 21LCFQ02]|uniref:hypothetical protein n=1 Tax=unclassified Pseudomonas TaxID=196821 RepID=UPI0004F6E90B|nr:MULTISPECIES: hypothetical protein [unclassified Pseudomonas]MCO8165228.1 hypothetical protein [Pseudomonas sp. 21LCFQ010]MCO8169774.1 hypothetical protein [Pseudomonas sp. 21LCFQ02]MCQ9425259.1 hypothetical protein [Pseudomonas sp. LJDD11]BAP41860.1 putative uncharacterized protein [Pseudomonas sp. StFLB209]